jgi:hypothetical protein
MKEAAVPSCASASSSEMTSAREGVRRRNSWRSDGVKDAETEQVRQVGSQFYIYILTLD